LPELEVHPVIINTIIIIRKLNTLFCICSIPFHFQNICLFNDLQPKIISALDIM